MVRKILLWIFSFMLAASPVFADSQGSATGGTAATQSTLAGGIYNSSAPTLTNGQQIGLQTDQNGQLKVTVSGGGSNACASATGSAVPSAACANGLNVSGTLRGQTGTNTSGSVYAGDTNVVQSALPTNAAQESGGNLASAATNLGTLAAAVGSPIPAGTAAIGTLTGSTAYGLQSAGSTNATSVKGSAGVLKAMNLINTTTTIYYLRMYNLSSSPTCSSATGFVRTWPVPPAAASGGAGGIAVNLGAGGTTFSTGIAFCLTGGPTSTDNTNAASGVFINLDYQ